MARLSDFVWNAKTQPQASRKSNSIVIAIHHPPGRNADVMQGMEHNCEDINVQGSLFDQSDSTREAQRDGLMKTFYRFHPMSFIGDVDSTFGLSGDAYTEAATSWTPANCSVAANATYHKIGSNSLAVTGLGGSNETLLTPAWTAVNCNLPYYSSLCFWLRLPAITAGDDITVRMLTSAGNYYHKEIDVSSYLGGWIANVWKECIVPLGTTISGWGKTGSPDWESITQVQFAWDGAASDTVYLDGLCIAYGMRFAGLQSFMEFGGQPNAYFYEFTLTQYLG